MTEDTKQYLIVRNQQDGDYKINLIYFFTQIRHYVRHMAGITSLSILFSLTLLFFLKPQYETIAYLTAPISSHYQNIYLNKDNHLTGWKLFGVFTTKLINPENINAFLKTTDNYGTPLKNSAINLDAAQNHSIILVGTDKIGRKGTVDTIKLATRALTPDLARKNNKAYINYINQIALSQLAYNQLVVRQRKIKVLENSIRSDAERVAQARNNKLKRLMTEQSIKMKQIQKEIVIQTNLDQREKEIKLRELNQALALAQATPSKQLTDAKTAVTLIKNNSDLYLRGSSYLKKDIQFIKNQKHSPEFEKKIAVLESKLASLENNAQIDALKNGENDLLYIPNIEKKQSELDYLKSYSLNTKNMKCYYAENLDTLPVTKISPNNRLVLFLGFMLGISLSMIFLVLKSNILELPDKK